MILAGFAYDPKICNFKFQNEFKMKLFRGFQGKTYAWAYVLATYTTFFILSIRILNI